MYNSRFFINSEILFRKWDCIMMNIKRVLLKLSGESLAAGHGTGIDTARLNAYAAQIKGKWSEAGVEIGIVIGGGNIFRGLSGAGKGFDRGERRPDGNACHCHKLACLEFGTWRL